MKKHYIILSGLLMITGHAFGARTEDEVFHVIVSSHTLAFGKDNLFKEQIPSSEISKWDQAISAAKEFVLENCKNQLGVKDGDLTSALSAIEKANINLVNAIKVTYGSRTNKAAVSKQIDFFNEIKKSMVDIGKKLEKINFTLSTQPYKGKKEDAKKLLSNMSTYIDSIAGKAQKDAKTLL